MIFDYSPYFKKYLALVEAADQVFDGMLKKYPELVKCKIECSDCCHALFDLTLIEAIYINHQFNKKFEGMDKQQILEKANKMDRYIYRIKRKAYQALRNGEQEGEILNDLSSETVRCPLLNDKNRCDLYEYRPLTCRFYGVPVAISGEAHICGKTGFLKGHPYPTVKMDAIHRKLQEITAELVRDINTQYIKLADLLVPLSMALLTVYDEQYFGIDTPDNEAASGK
jgi:Fe-S-cluster containining protein